jgi:hypothetical protein
MHVCVYACERMCVYMFALQKMHFSVWLCTARQRARTRAREREGGKKRMSEGAREILAAG